MLWTLLSFLGTIIAAVWIPRSLLHFYASLVEIHYPIARGRLFELSRSRIYTKDWLAIAITGGLIVALGFAHLKDMPWVATAALPVGIGVIGVDALFRTFRHCHSSLRELGFNWPPEDPAN